MALTRRRRLDVLKPLSSRRRPSMYDMIGRRLRLHYEETQRHPLPAQLDALLQQLAEDPAPSRRH